MENPGEHLVGQYLKEIEECDFVEYNLKLVQGEIDVVGIHSAKRQVYICEVATHLETGLQYTKDNKPDNVERFISKFGKDIEYAKHHFPRYKHHYMLWSPIIKIPKKEGAKNNQYKDLHVLKTRLQNEHGIVLELIYNETYMERVEQLRKAAGKTTQEMRSPIMRFLQIEEKLKIHCKKISEENIQ